MSAGASPIGLKRGIPKAVDAVIKELERVAIPVKGQQEIIDVASVSASSNREVGEMIAQAIEKVGRTGVITVEEAKGTETTIEIVEGMQFDRGYMSAYFCTNADKMTVEMKNASLLLVDKKISSVHDLLPILQSIASTGKDLVVVAEDLEGDVLSTLVVNRLRGTLRVVSVKAPGFGDNRKAMLQDIAVLTGATVISSDTGMNLREADASVLGACDKVTITKDHTTLVSSNGDKEAIKARMKQIDGEIKKTTSDYEKKKLEERKAKLSGGVAQIHVGAATEPEMKNKKQAFEDSLNSTKAALESGIVPGGGVALLVAGDAAKKLQLEGDELLGAKIVALACETPIRQIVANAGRDSSVVVAEVLQRGVPFGFNALTERVEDLVAAGVIDPVKVVKNALLYASSASSHHPYAIAAHEFSGAIGEGVRPGADGFMREVAAKVVGERAGRDVAFLRILLERFGYDGIEVAAQESAELVGCRGASRGGLEDLLPAIPVRGQSIGWARGFGLHDSLNQVRGGVRARAGRMLSRQK